jgi:hypothetical protein
MRIQIQFRIRILIQGFDDQNCKILELKKIIFLNQ